MRSSMKTFTALVALALGSAGFAASAAAPAAGASLAGGASGAALAPAAPATAPATAPPTAPARAPAPRAAAAGPVPLSQAFDNVGITAAASTAPGNLDGTGDSFPAAGLARDGISPGASLRHDGLTLRWPDVAPGHPDNVLADGQVIALRGSGNTLGVAAASTGGSTSGTLTVTYTDGTATTDTVRVANWVSTSAAAAPSGAGGPAGPGESDLLATTAGWNPAGSAPVSLSYLSVPVDPAKTVASVTLPTVGSTVGRNVPALHVFALAVGTVAARATDGPGALSYYDLARKDCVGTAPNTSSKTWYTVAGGMLSDVYYPTIDNTNVHSLEYVVAGRANGAAFTDIQPRDMTYTVTALGTAQMACEVTATAKNGSYKIVTDYLTDPGRSAVVMRVSFDPLTAAAAGDHLYARLQPLVNGHGGGGSQNAGAGSATTVHTAGGPVPVDYSTNSLTEALNRTFATPTYMALAASRPFPATGNGFAGQPSDGLTQLSSGHALTGSYQNASNGDVTSTVEVPATGSAPQSSVRDQTTLVLGFGRTEDAATSTALASARTPFGATLDRYEAQWQRYDAGLKTPPASITGLSAAAAAKARAGYWLGANVIKASLDKTFAGAAAAGLASPWGQAVPAGNAAGGLAPYFGSYRETFSRDAYETFTGFLTDGDLASARAIDLFLFGRQQLANGSLPRNSLPNGKAAPDTGGLQLDETSYPILMAWQAGLGGDHALYIRHVKPAAEFLVAHGPSAGVERWEEQTGFSPSTIAAEIAGLVAAGQIASQNGDPAAARVFLATADEYQRDVIPETVTTNGPDSTGPNFSGPYFIRLSKTGDPNAAISYNLGNGGPTLDQRSVIDAGFLDLARLGELPQSLPLFANSLKVVDATIAASTPTGTGYHRYNGDGYGDANGTGRPWPTTDTGTGHPWPVLSGERAEHDLAVGDTAGATGTAGQLGFMLDSASGVGLIPEQVWEQPDLPASPYGSDPTTASIGFTDGHPAGSAAPLTWATAQEVRLILDLGAGRLLEQPSIVANRYVTRTQGETPLALTAPVTETGSAVKDEVSPPQATVSGTTVTVSGTAAPGARVDIMVSDIQVPNGTAAVSSLTAGSSGAFSATVTVPAGDQSHVAVTATAPNAAGGGTNAAGFDVTSLAVPGTIVLNAAGPAGGGAGPGNFALPTATNGSTPVFPAGSFTITDFRVARATATTSFQIGIGDLTNPFGGPNGFSLQLVDLYIRQPGLASYDYSTAPTYPSRNYTIAPSSAWSQSIEVDGFGRAQWNTALGATPGAIASVSGNPVSGQITITVPTATLGTVGPGWTFTVALAGQDGFGTDDGRAFTATPGQYSFGVCSAAEAGQNPEPQACQVSPSIEPEVMDTVPPSGVALPEELNVLAYPGNTTTTLVTPPQLQGVTVP